MIRSTVAKLLHVETPTGTMLSADHETLLELAQALEARHAATPYDAPGRYYLKAMADNARGYIGATL